MNRSIGRHCCRVAVLALGWAIFACGAPRGGTPPAPTSAPVWHDSLTDAVVEEGQLHLPMLLFFADGNRRWDLRMRDDVLSDRTLSELLSKFTCVRLDTASNEAAANRYGVKTTPVLLVISPSGRERARSRGFARVDSVRSFLLKALGPQGNIIADRQLRRLLAGIGKQNSAAWSDEEWVQVLLAMGKPQRRDVVRTAILDAAPFPLKQLVARLEHPLLAVRCAALELLEERTGQSFGFDPWRPKAETNLGALEQWRSVRLTRESGDARYAILSAAEAARLVDELLSDRPEVASRAMRRFLHGGMSSVAVLNRYQQQHLDLPAGVQRQIRMVTFAAALQKAENLRAERCAHKLVFGSLDTRLAAIRTLSKAGEGGIAVLRDLLHEQDPLLREAAAEALAEGSDARAVKVLAKHLDSEQDVDVIVAIARCLGDTRTRRSLLVLTQMLEREEEDVVIAALRALAKFRNRQIVTKPLLACLRHQSWRIRAAAVECLAELPEKDRPEELHSLVTDPDPFVRTVVLKALPAKRVESMKSELLEAYAKYPDSRAAILAILAAGGDVPAQIVAQLPKASPDTLRRAISLLSEGSSSFSARSSDQQKKTAVRDAVRLLAKSAIASENESVRLAGYTTLARAAKTDAAARQLIIHALDDGPENLRLTILRELQIQPLPSLRYSMGAEEKSTPSSGGDDAVNELLDAFGDPADDRQEADKQADTPPPDDDVAALMDAFAVEESAAADRPADLENDRPSSATLAELHAAVRKLMTSGTRRERILAAVQLLRMQDPAALNLLAENAAQIPVEMAVKLGSALQALREHSGSKELVRGLLRSPDAQTRQSLCRIILQTMEPTSWMSMMMLDALNDEQPLTAEEAFSGYQLRYILSDPNKAGILRPFAQYMYKRGQTVPLKRLAFYLSMYRPGKSDALRARSSLDSPDAALRRLAWLLLANADFDEFARRAGKLAQQDDLPVQRLVAEMVLQSVEVTLFEGSLDLSLPNEVAQLLARRLRFRREEFKSLLRSLSVPPHAAEVRLLGLLARLRLDEQVSSAQVDQELQNLEDAADFIRKIPSSVRRQLSRKSSEVATVLARHLSESGVSSYGFFDRGASNINLDEDATEDLPPAVRDVVRLQADANVTTRVTTPVDPRSQSSSRGGEDPDAEPRNAVIHLFTTPGCRDCEEIHGMLVSLAEGEENLQLRVHDVTFPEAAAFNQTLAARFSLPKELHLATPAVFCAAGALAGEQATPQAVYDLALASPWTPAVPDWDKPASAAPPDPSPSAAAETAAPPAARPQSLAIQLGMGAVALLCLLLLIAVVARRRQGPPT